MSLKTVAEAVKEVKDAKAELQDAEQVLAAAELAFHEAGQRFGIAQLRRQEAESVLVSIAESEQDTE